mgnify:CR=1 FL=1
MIAIFGQVRAGGTLRAGHVEGFVVFEVDGVSTVVRGKVVTVVEDEGGLGGGDVHGTI